MSDPRKVEKLPKRTRVFGYAKNMRLNRITAVVILLPMGLTGQAADHRTVSKLGVPITVVPRSGTPAGQFREFSDGVVDRAGNVYVIDTKQKLLAVFDRSGYLVTSLGAAEPRVDADFPGTALAIDAADVVYALERLGRKVRKYKLHGKYLEPVGIFDTRTSMGNFCILGSDLYTIGSADGKIVHRYDLMGQHVQSFGAEYSQHKAINESSTTLGGHIACLPEAGIVAVATSLFDSVRAYSASGTLLWNFSVPGFRPAKIKELPGNAFHLSTGKGPTDKIVSLFRERTGRMLGIQVAQFPNARATTLLINARVGTLAEGIDSLPRIRRTVRDLAIVLHGTDKPTLSVHKWR